MPFTPHILTTDWLIYALMAVIVVFAIYTRRHEHLLVPWRQVTRRPMAMGALVVLLAFIAIGLLDSMHYRPRLPGSGGQYSSEVRSALDALLLPLKQRSEKTYSVPLATHAHGRETVQRPDGTLVREYPRLRHGGAHLREGQHRLGDIAFRLVQAFALALLLWLPLVAVVAWRHGPASAGWRRLWRGEGDFPWRTVLVAIGALLAVVVNLAWLSTFYHVLGTDQVGQDVLLKSLKSVRTGLVIGTLTTLVMLPFALLFGILAGYARGVIDDVIQYVYTTLSSIPDVLLIAAGVLSLQVYMAHHPELFDNVTTRADWRLLFLCLILGLTSWTGLCRLLRGEVLKLREADYVLAARSLGAGHLSIMVRHLLPNVMHIVLIAVVLDFSGLVLAEAVLSYIGVGVDPTMDSWGNMINGARLEMAREPMVWWTLGAAFLFMFTLVLAANLFADAVRDAFDPRMRR